MTALLLTSAVKVLPAFAGGENQAAQPSEIRPVVELNHPGYSEASAEKR